jgi:hypothetical protein
MSSRGASLKARILRMTSSPSNPGRSRAVATRDGVYCRAAPTPAGPVSAVWTSNFSSLNASLVSRVRSGRLLMISAVGLAMAVYLSVAVCGAAAAGDSDV